MDSLGSLLMAEDILVDVEVSGKEELLSAVGRHMESRHGLPSDRVTQGLMRRESMGSTAVGQGVAIPHTRVRDVDHMLIAYLRLRTPVSFDAPDNLPVRDILVLLAPKQADESHLVILAEAAHMFSNVAFRDRLHRCADPVEVKHLFDTWTE